MAGSNFTNPEFELRGFNHIAFVARDMEETVRWYEDVLGFRLFKTQEMPGGGQHFFLEMGNGVDGIAFFWWPDAVEGTPGEAISAAYDDDMQRTGKGGTAIGTMNHIAFDVPADKIDEYREKLRAKGVAVTEIINHANSERRPQAGLRPGAGRRRRLHPVAVLQGPERDAARVRLLDDDVRRVRRPAPPEDHPRPGRPSARSQL